jgi:nucleoside 2-deoxyribosyltransferase
MKRKLQITYDFGPVSIINMKIRMLDAGRVNVDELNILLNRICKKCADLVDASASSIFLKEGEFFIMRAAFGYSQQLVGKAGYKQGEGITGWIALGNKFVANSDKELKRDPKHIGKYDKELWGDGKSSCCGMIGIPLVSDGIIIGLIKVENKKKSAFTEDDEKSLEIFAIAAAAAIESKRELINIIKGFYVFVLMPFSKEFDDVYECGIKPTINKLGMRCERVDEILDSKEDILTEIYNGIKRADFIVADMSGKNSNVFYEVGYADALGKKIIFLTKKRKDIPFNLTLRNHIIYDGKIKFLSNKLEERLKAMVNARTRT